MISLLAGSKLGRYQVTDQIGKGAAAYVFRAYDPDLNREVALKVLPVSRRDEVSFVERFRNEAQAVARLSHPNIMPIFDFGEDKGFAFIVTRYVTGGTLHERMGEKTDLPSVIAYLTPVADALDYAHRQGVVHRDIKPANVLLDEDLTPILADFGIAVVLEAEARLTRDGMIMGTPAYISPEQVMGKAPDPRSDIYSLGVLLYELLLGRPLFKTESQAATLLAHVHEPVDLSEDSELGLSPELKAVLLAALAKDPQDRFQTAGELSEALVSVSVRPMLDPPPIEQKSVSPRRLALSLDTPNHGGRDGPNGLGSPDAVTPIRVFLVEDHRVVLEGLQPLLEVDGGVEVVGAARTAEEALPQLEALACDVVVTDISLPGMSGIEATRQIKGKPGDTKVLILSGHGESYLNDAIRAGADGYLMKSGAGGDKLRTAISDVHAGGSAIDPRLAQSLFRRVADLKTGHPDTVADRKPS